MSATKPLRILCLGDSYTAGEGVSVAERWPSLLADRLRQEGLAVAAPVVIAQTGWTAEELLVATRQRLPAGTFDLVTLMVGVNDQYRGLPVEGYRASLEGLSAAATRAAGDRKARVLFISIPDWGVAPFAADRDRKTIAEGIDRFNAAGAEVARTAGFVHVDVTSASRTRTAAADFAGDGLHPSARQHEAWLRPIASAAQQALGLGFARQIDSGPVDDLG